MNLQFSEIKQFIKSSGIFLIGNVVSKAAMVVLLPLYTNYISADDLGYYDLSVTCITLIATAMYFEIWTVALRYMYTGVDGGPDLEAIRCCGIIFCMSTVPYAMLCTAAILFDVVPFAVLIFLYGISMNLANFAAFLSRGLGHNIEFAVSGVINTGVTIFLNVVFIAALRFPYPALYIAGAIGCLTQFLYLMLRLHLPQFLRGPIPSHECVTKVLIYALPLCVNSTAFWLQTSFGKVVLNMMFGDSANGIYSIGSKFSVALSLLTGCFTYAWQDLAFSHGSDSQGGGFYTRAVGLYTCLIALGAAGLLPLIKLVFPLLVSEGYSSAASTIPLFIVVASLSAVSTFIGNIFYAVDETKTIFYSALLAATVNVLLSWPLIHFFGINGVNLATSIGFAIGIVYRVFRLKDAAGLRFEKRVILSFAPLALSCVLFIFGSIQLNAAFFVVFVSVGVGLWIKKR